jgi:hypothetical protein
MIYMEKKKGEVEDVVGTRLNISQFAKRSLESRLAATEKALKAEKVRSTYDRDSEKFKDFMEMRLKLYDSLKSGVIENTRIKKGYTTRYYERMYNNTKEILDTLA